MTKPKLDPETKLSVLDQTRQREEWLIGKRVHVRASIDETEHAASVTFEAVLVDIGSIGFIYYYIFDKPDEPRFKLKWTLVLKIGLAE
jgi:hypothetical protein